MVTHSLSLGLRRTFRWAFILADVRQPILGANFLRNFNLLLDITHHQLLLGWCHTPEYTGNRYVRLVPSTDFPPSWHVKQVCFPPQRVSLRHPGTCEWAARGTLSFTPHTGQRSLYCCPGTQAVPREAQDSPTRIWPHARTGDSMSLLQPLGIPLAHGANKEDTRGLAPLLWLSRPQHSHHTWQVSDPSHSRLYSPAPRDHDIHVQQNRLQTRVSPDTSRTWGHSENRCYNALWAL